MSAKEFDWNNLTEHFSTNINEVKPLEIVAREEWGAEKAIHVGPMQFEAPTVFTSFTGTSMCLDKRFCCRMTRILQKRHISQSKKTDIKYNFLIGSDGRAYEGRGWAISPELPFDYAIKNRSSYYIAFIGDFKVLQIPTKMWLVLEDLIQLGVKENYISKTYTVEMIKRHYHKI